MLKTLTQKERAALVQKHDDGTVSFIHDAQSDGLKLSGFEDKQTQMLLSGMHYLKKSGLPTIKPLLPLFLALRGKPYSINRYFPFEPFFRTRLPQRSLLRTARQVSKSSSFAAQGIVFSNCNPYFSTLYITPLFEMIRRFSQGYVKQFLDESPVKRLFSGSTTVNSVLRRTFLNKSSMTFSFAFLDAERTRGINADANYIDEVQEMNWDFLDVIHETLSGSEDWGLIRYAGTPKSLENTIEKLWLESSQGEWATKCPHGGCGHWNVPSIGRDLEAMIGPAHDMVSDKCPGTLCALCQKPIDPSTGRWIHEFGDRRWDFPGYHVPQLIMPMHYANPDKWRKLVSKKKSMAPNTFFNEVCGEGYDSGAKLVTLTELKAAACLPWKNVAKDAIPNHKKYGDRIVVSVDWGGNGGKIKVGKQIITKTSFTVISVLGMLPDGKIDVLWAYRVLRSLDFDFEVLTILQAVYSFKAKWLVHDYGGAGAEREHLLAQANFPMERVMPMSYHGPGIGNFVQYMAPTNVHPRAWFSVDKSRSLGTTCSGIRRGFIRFFQYDYETTEQPGLLHDFLALQEEKSESRGRTDVYYITRNPTMPDDFAQSVNIGCCALWYRTGQWPKYPGVEKYTLSASLMNLISPPGKLDWDGI